MAIDWTRVSAELKAKIAARLPKGVALEQVKFAEASVVTLETIGAASPEEMRIAGEFEAAGGPPMITDGKPTIMRVVAWLAHEGINKNRLAFKKDDLAKAAAKITEPDFLPMDFNHSAINGYGWEQKAIGVWYRAELAFDPKAKNGAGAWGILATGMMWAWMNPELANTLLAEQARNGRMEFSMACIAGQIERAFDSDGAYEIADDTTFFTLSALDVPPADEDATGNGVEGSADPKLEQQLADALKNGTEPTLSPVPAPDAEEAALAAAALATPTPEHTKAEPETPALTGGHMEELLAQLKELSTAATKIVDANLAESINAKLDAKLAEMTALITPPKVEDRSTEVDALTTKVAELEGSVTDLQTAKDAVASELTKANEEVERLNGELATATEALSAYREAEATQAAEAKLTARIAELSEAYREAFGKRSDEEQASAKTRWASMSDEQWEAFKADVALVPTVRVSYLVASQREGVLPIGGVSEKGSVRERLSQFK